MKDSLTLRIDRDDEVVLPAAVADGDLSLSELGALVVIAAVAQGSHDFTSPRMQSEDMVNAVKSLMKREIFTATVEGGTVKLNIDLDKAMPPDSDEDSE